MKTNSKIDLAKISAFAVLSILPLMANAGVGSHGGNSIVCFSDPKIADQLTQTGMAVSKTIPDQYIPFITSVETLDLYEARLGLYGETAKNPVPIRGNETEEAYVNRIANRMQGWTLMDKWTRGGIVIHPMNVLISLMNVVNAGKSSFGGVAHVTDPTMIPANDITPITTARSGCVYATMAKQMNIGASDKKSIIIDDRLYLHPSHSLLSRATLLIHEYILSQMGVANGTTDRVRATVATLISKDATLLDMIRVAGANMGSTKVIPVSVDTLILEAGRIQAEINVSYSATSSTEAKTFIENHLYELPRKIRKRLEGKIALETINSCKEASLNAGCILSEQECNLFLDFVSRRNGQIAEKWNPIKEQIKAKYAPSWENLVNTALNKISYIRLTGVRRTALIEAVKASPYEKEYTASPAFYFDQSEVLFNEE